MSKGLSDYFKRFHVSRAARREHHPCRTHGAVKHVCRLCAKVFCPKCGEHTCGRRKEPAPKSLALYRPTKAMRPIWNFVKLHDAVRIEEHDDSGGYKIIFIPMAMRSNTASDLADRVWSIEGMRDIAEPTAFRSGRDGKLWWVSFQFKEQAHAVSTPGPTESENVG